MDGGPCPLALHCKTQTASNPSRPVLLDMCKLQSTDHAHECSLVKTRTVSKHTSQLPNVPALGNKHANSLTKGLGF